MESEQHGLPPELLSRPMIISSVRRSPDVKQVEAMATARGTKSRRGTQRFDEEG